MTSEEIRQKRIETQEAIAEIRLEAARKINPLNRVLIDLEALCSHMHTSSDTSAGGDYSATCLDCGKQWF